MLSGNIIRIRPWEEDLAGSVGVSVLTLRFALSFFASILTGYIFRYVPTVKGIDPTLPRRSDESAVLELLGSFETTFHMECQVTYI